MTIVSELLISHHFSSVKEVLILTIWWTLSSALVPLGSRWYSIPIDSCFSESRSNLVACWTWLFIHNLNIITQCLLWGPASVPRFGFTPTFKWVPHTAIFSTASNVIILKLMAASLVTFPSSVNRRIIDRQFLLNRHNTSFDGSSRVPWVSILSCPLRFS